MSADALFAQADINNDGRIDYNEFRNFVGNNIAGSGAVNYGSAVDLSGLGAAGNLSSAYQTSTYESSSNGGALAGDLAYVGGAAVGLGGVGTSAYESSSYSSSAGDLAGGLAGGYGVVGADYAAGNYGVASESAAVQRYATDARGLYVDANPQIIRRPAPGGVQTYTQNIRVRFLQPPPVPPHGPLIIREVRPPQPPVPAPLRIRQQAPPLPTPAPLVLRERPPVAPASIATQTVIRRLAPLPVPPRSVIIERLPALPRRPRDIVIERWVPYGAQAKRRTLVQRAGAAQQYAQPRNVIVQYEQSPARIVRQFQRLGVTAESPSAYVSRYGGSLLDAASLVAQARAAGVVEDITAPGFVGSAAATGFIGSAANAGFLTGAGSYDSGLVGLGGASTYESSSYSVNNGLDYDGFAAAGLGVGAGYGSSSYLSTAETSGLGTELAGASTYESSSYSSSTGNVGDAAFAAADVNGDGLLTRSEFSSVVA